MMRVAAFGVYVIAMVQLPEFVAHGQTASAVVDVLSAAGAVFVAWRARS